MVIYVVNKGGKICKILNEPKDSLCTESLLICIFKGVGEVPPPPKFFPLFALRYE